ncbi:MAG: aminopeptidase P family protein [Armatimonadetes bacterium]|nr:aminopeptidase P family protein [Armatimonadota bacterium]
MTFRARAAYDWASRQRWLDLPFPVEEYHARVERIRQHLNREELDAALVFGNPGRPGPVRYVSNFNSFLGSTLVVVPAAGDVALVTETIFHHEPMHAMIWTTWVEDVRCTDFPLANTSDDLAAHVRDVFRERGLERGRVALVGERWIPAGLEATLRRDLPRVAWVSGARLWLDVTARKSRAEIAVLREAAAIAGRGFKAALAAAVPGAAEYQVAGAAAGAMMEAGAQEVWTPMAVAFGPRAGFKHSAPTGRRIQQGDAFFIDLSPVRHGYIVDVARTGVVGSGPSRMRAMLDTALGMADAVVAAARPGVQGGELVALCRRIATAAGFEDLFYPDAVGHGVGTTKFETPLLLGEHVDVVLEEGMVFSLEPMLVEESLGTAVVEDEILITPGGAEILPCFTRKLW